MRWLPILLLLAACTPGPGKGADTAEARIGPDIVLSTVALRYGLLAPGAEEVKSLSVRNDGGAPLEVADIAIEGGAFRLVTDPSFRVPVGEQVYVDIAFSPPDGPAHSGTATLSSNDPDEPEVVVELYGEGEVPALAVEVPADALADVFHPCSGSVPVTLRSTGTQPVEVSAVELAGTPWVLAEVPELPLVLPPGATANVTVDYGPAPLEPEAATLTVRSDDPDGADVATLTAPGGYVEVRTDPFTAPIDAPVDILFALDRSCSMVSEGEALAAGFEAFITTIEEVTDEWRIGVATAETGCFTNGILDVGVPDYAALFQDAVTTGERNPLSERLLFLTDNALVATAPGGCNEGFLRPGALLHVIVISDEEDQSPRPWDEWVSHWVDQLAAPELLKVSIIGDLYVVCGRGTGAAGYEEAADATGGLKLDVCDDAWAEDVDELALASLTALRDYPLTAVPDPASIVVTVDGVDATGWVWDPETNTVSFADPPVGGEAIAITYGVPQVCG